MTPEQIAVLKDEDIDVSDILPLDESFWNNARVVCPARFGAITVRMEIGSEAFSSRSQLSKVERPCSGTVSYRRL